MRKYLQIQHEQYYTLTNRPPDTLKQKHISLSLRWGYSGKIKSGTRIISIQYYVIYVRKKIIF